MSGPVILRLQNLPLEANSQDIRRFFDGLVIPDGGVHIIGGDKGDAFIAFHNDDDLRQAMHRDGYYLCNTRIKLYTSSKNEMQNVIQAARNSLNQQQAAVPSIPKVSNAMAQQQQRQHQQPTTDLLSSLTKFISPLSPTHYLLPSPILMQQQQQLLSPAPLQLLATQHRAFSII